MPARPEPGEPGRHVFGRDADGAGQRGGGQGVGEPGRATRADVRHPRERDPLARRAVPDRANAAFGYVCT